MNKYHAIMAGLAVVGLGLSTARGGIVAVGPFVGDLTETWEEYPSPPGEEIYVLPNPSAIMGGAATISSPDTMVIYEPGVHNYHLGTSGTAQVSDGTKGMGLDSLDYLTTATLVFETPVTQFGAFWGAATSRTLPPIGDPATINVSFFDVSDLLIATIFFDYSRTAPGGFPGDGVLEWHGWQSSIPIKSITYSEDGVVIDGLQAELVPEPATCSLLTLAIAAWPRGIRSRRK